MYFGDTLKKIFSNRGYTEKLLDNAKKLCDQVSRIDILDRNVKLKTRKDRIPIILTYHPCNLPIIQTILKDWSSLQSSSNPELFTNKPFAAYRKPANIKNKVVRASTVNYSI